MSDVPLEFGGAGIPRQQPSSEHASTAPDETSPTLPVPADQSILRDIETASQTIALYTAIIGKRPEIVDPATLDALEDGPPPILTISPSWPQVNRMMIGVWFKRMSHHARKRIDEAMTRLAG